MVEKYCKCGHNKNIHKKNSNSILSKIDFCRKCSCSDYMNRNLPNLTSKISFIAGVIIFGVFTILTIMILFFVYSASFTLEWNNPVKDVTVGEWLTILSISLIIVNLLLYSIGHSLFSFIQERKRPSYPLEKGE